MKTGMRVNFSEYGSDENRYENLKKNNFQKSGKKWQKKVTIL
jgi:hypothetical protein